MRFFLGKRTILRGKLRVSGWVYIQYIYKYIYIHPYIAGQLIDQRFFMVIYQIAPAKTILHLKMYFLLNMGIFQCHVSFQVCNIFSSFHFKRIQVLSFWAKFHPSWSTDFSETTSSVLPYLSVKRRCITKIHRKNGGTLGARGPLNNQPYITWVFIGFQIPLQKRDPTRGRFKQLGALRLKGTSLKVFRKNPRGLGGSYHKKSRCISRHRGFFISEKW